MEQSRLDAFVVLFVDIKRALVSDGLRGLARHDGIGVEPVRTFPQRATERSEMRFHAPDVELCEIADGPQSPRGKDLARPLADAPEPAQLERREERGFSARRHHDEAVR